MWANYFDKKQFQSNLAQIQNFLQFCLIWIQKLFKTVFSIVDSFGFECRQLLFKMKNLKLEKDLSKVEKSLNNF